MLGGLVAWFVVGAGLAVVVGRGIRIADQRSATARRLTTADVPAMLAVAPASSAAPAATTRVRRRAIPLPPVGIALALVAVSLETVGYLVRLTGDTGGSARLWSMDAPFSVPRLFVALLFAAAAAAAMAGAGAIPGRRTWWSSIGVVAGAIAVVKFGSGVHAEALRALEGLIGAGPALLVSVVAAALVIGGLWLLSRTERRDRRRLLGVLGLYAVASVVLSALSSLVAGAYGAVSTIATTATYIEESGEALAGVAFLVAVLVGVAPRLVLPAEWALRREADAQTLDLPEVQPGRSAQGTARG